MASINFFNQDIHFNLAEKRKTSQWIKAVIKKENKSLVNLNYIFCSDQYLLEINQQYLNHAVLTDIITFDNSSEKEVIEGDVFISIDRVKDNALSLKVNFDEEVHRVLIHGVLHLSGYSDKTSAEKAQMRIKEDAYLSLRKNSST
ncbi:MAG: rRNA maturation RNase YbeY [Cyclobacteriaceae bacterium]